MGSAVNPNKQAGLKNPAAIGLGFWDSVQAQENSSVSLVLLPWTSPWHADMRPGAPPVVSVAAGVITAFTSFPAGVLGKGAPPPSSGRGRKVLRPPLSFQDPAPHRGRY